MAPAEAELKELMLAGLVGDAAAHRSLLGHLSHRLRAYFKGKLAGIGRSAVEAEDLVQEALLAIHTRRHTFDPTEMLMPWVYAIARYKLIDHLRATRHARVDVPIENADEVLAKDDHTAAESAYDLHNLLGRLPGKTRCAIERVKLEGLSVAEAARLCKMSESSVKVSIHRGLQALAAAIAQEKHT